MIQRVVFVAALTALVGCQPAGDVGESSAELVVTDQCEISGLGVLAGGDLGVGRITGGDTGKQLRESGVESVFDGVKAAISLACERIDNQLGVAG